MPLDPQLQALYTSLTNSLVGGQLTLNEQTMNGPSSLPVVALFEVAFGLDAITLGNNPTVVADQTNNLVRVGGTGVTTLFNLDSTVVALAFGSATPSTLSATGTVTPPDPATWKFSQSYPPLANSYFDSLQFTSPNFTISTYAAPNSALGVTVVEGAGIYIKPTALAGPLAPLLELNPTLPTPLPPYYGSVKQDSTAFTIAMAMPFSNVTINVIGFPPLFFPDPSAMLRAEQMTIEDSPQILSTTITVEATVSFSGIVTVPMAIGVPWEGGWILSALPAISDEISDLTSFLALFTSVHLIEQLPATFVIIEGFYLTSFWAPFDLQTGITESWGFTIATDLNGPTWTVIPGVIELRLLNATMAVNTLQPGGSGAFETLVTGSFGGGFRVGGTVDLLVIFPIPLGDEWTIASQNEVVLPTLADLASLVGGVDIATMLPPGVAEIGGFSIQGINLIVNPVTLSIKAFNFRLGSTNPWDIVPGQLSLTNLVLSFNVEDPFGVRAVTGIIYGVFRIGNFDVHAIVARQPYQISWSMQIWSPLIPLPSISDLDQLIGTSIAPYLPDTLATLSFGIYNFRLDLNISPAEIKQMSFELACDQEWTIITDVLVVTRVGLSMNLSWFTGSLLTDLGVSGDLQVVGTGVNVEAMRSSDGTWTFTGMLGEGEVLSLGALVAQFLQIKPAYLPALNVEGLIVRFTTNNDTFFVSGRTAGFWTYEVSSALTLRMRAAAFFQRDAAGNTAGALEGEFHINSLQIFVSYQFDTTSNTLIFRILYKRFSLSAALTSGKDKNGKEYTLLKFTLGDLSLGEILEWLVNLAVPGSTFSLPAPWDVLNQINFKNLSLVVDLKTYDVTVNYAIDVNLVFMKITSIGLKYSDIGGEGSVKIALSGEFLGQEYSSESGNPLEWDVLRDPAPEVPAQGPTLVDIKYVGLGQRVAFSNTQKLDTVGDVITALRAEMQPVKDPSRNPLAVGNGSLMRFDRSSHLLAGADFEVLETVSVAFIFNDPYLYGMRIGLAGERAGSLAGLQFELLYKKITNDIGVFKVELRVPEAFRQFEFGEVSLTLPVIKVDVYTNGNFRVDLGFPHGGDFSDSFCLQIFPFIGFGGFYFAYLTGATSERVPVITNGTFNPVIEFGLGLQVGLGKEIRKGPLSGGIYVTVVGILEGVVAWFSPDDKAARDGTYYWVEGIVGIVGKVYGSVDFAVIKVSVSLTARLTVRVTLEAYQATTIQVKVEVEASATVTIFFIDIDFSFTVELDEQFTIGESSPTPWLAAPKSTSAGAGNPQLRLQRSAYLPKSVSQLLRPGIYSDQRTAARALGLAVETLTWDPVLVFGSKQDLDISLMPAITVATPAGTTTPVLQLDFVLFVENSIAPGATTRKQRRTPSAAHSSRTDDPMTVSFNLLVQSMFLWSINSVIGRMTGNVTAADLDVVYAVLLDPETFNTGFTNLNLTNFLAANFNGMIAGLPQNVESADTTSSTVLSMLPQLTYTFGAATVDFSAYGPVSAGYEQQIRTYYDQLVVDYEWGRAAAGGIGGAPSAKLEAAGGTESMATFIFREYFMIVARTAIQSARDLLAKYSYSPDANDSLNTICGRFPPVPTKYTVHEGDTVASIAEMFGMTIAQLEALNNDSLHDPLTPGTKVNVQVAITPDEVAFANREAALTTGTPLTIESVLYQVKPGDTLTSIGTTFGSLSPSSLIGVPVNSANRQLINAGASIAIAQPVSPSYNWFNYTSVAGDNLQAIAAWAFLRAAGSDPEPNEAWYAQTIVNFNTDPQNPYEAPNFTGVIATGTSLKIPAALNDSDPSHALTYVTRAGDTLALAAGYYDILQNAPSLLTTIENGLQSLNSGIDWNNLPAGTTIHVPAQTYIAAAGDSFDSIATLFLIAATDLTGGTNPTSTSLLAPLSVLAIPPFTYGVATNDTIAIIGEKLSITIAVLATDIATVTGLFLVPADPPLTIPGVLSYSIADLNALLISSGAANEASMAVSRFLASGLQLPLENDPSALQGLYVLTGQQMTCPPPPATITFNKASGANWLTFVDSFVSDGTPLTEVNQKTLRERNRALDLADVPPGRIVLSTELDSLPIDITQALLDAYAPSTTFDPQILTGPNALDIKEQTEVTYRLYQNVHWQTSSTIPYGGNPSAPLSGEPSVWLFSESLRACSKALGYGTTPFTLSTAAGDPAITPTTNPVVRYDWAAMINLYVRQVSAPDSQNVLPNTYEFAGTDDGGKALLLALVQTLTAPGSTETAQLYLLYAPNADSNNSNGLASGTIDTARTFLVKTNLSTLTTSGAQAAAVAPKANLYGATIASTADFLQLLWEGSVTATGGYILGYADTSGNGLPNEVFAASALGTLQLVVVLATQSAASPDRKLYAFNNCAVAGDNIDPSRQTVFASITEASKVEYRESAALPPGNAGFTLTRRNPGTELDPQTPEEKRTRQLYSLLAYNVVQGGGFSGGNEGLPVSPVVEGDQKLVWMYKQVLSLTKLATSTLPAAAFLPAAANDPYAGITSTSAVTMELDFHDLYGNETISTTPVPNLTTKVGYYDDLVGLANWPGITTSYIVNGTPAAPKMELDAALQVSNYVPGSGTSYEQAQKNASAHIARYEGIYYQVWQNGLTLAMTTSLVQAPNAQPQVFTLDLIPFAKFASGSYIFISAALRFAPATVVAGTGTLLSIAQSYTSDPAILLDAVAALGKANRDTPTASLFAASLAMPQLYTTAFGDTLQSIAAKNASGGTITVVQLATQNQIVPLNAGTDIVAPRRTSDAVTNLSSFDSVADAMSATVAGLADANAATQGLLTEGFALTVKNVTVTVGLDATSGKTQSLADLVPVFYAQGLTVTPAMIAVSNDEKRGIFITGQTLVANDYVIQANDTFASLEQQYPQFTIQDLATAAANSPNIFPSGIPLLVRLGTPRPLSPVETLLSISNVYGLTVEQLAIANQTTALVSTAAVRLPDRVTIDATNPAALTPYTVPSAGISINAIVQTFGESDANTFATRNWTLTYIFVPGQTIAVGSASTETQANDSLASVYTRLHSQDASITPQQYVTAIAPSTTIIAAGALFATILPSTGGSTTTLAALGVTFAADPASIAQVNSSLAGFLVSGATVNLGTLSLTTNPTETFTSVVSRFALQYGVQTTVAEIARQNLTQPLIAAPQRFLMGPAPVLQSVILPLPQQGQSNFPSNPFRAVVDVNLARNSSLIDPQFTSVPSVAASTARIAPFLTPPTTDPSGAISLETFAFAFEGVFPKTKVAVGGDTQTGGGARDVWVVDFGPQGISSVTIDGASPAFFAIPPIENALQDLTNVPIRVYDPVTGTLKPTDDPPLLDFQSIDLDVWADTCLAAIEQILSAAYAGPAFRIDSDAVKLLIGAKKLLADNISDGVLAVLASGSGNLGDAQARLKQALLANLSIGYGTEAIVQYPVTVSSTFTTASNAPRLVGKTVDDAYRTSAKDDLASIATYYNVPQASIAMLLGSTIRILATGTELTFKATPYTILEGETIDLLMIRVGATSDQDFVDNLSTPNGFFLPYTVLGTDLVTGTTGDAGPSPLLINFATLADYYHVPLRLLATSIENTIGLFISGVTITVAGHGSLVITDQNNSLALAAAALNFAQPYELAEAMQLEVAKLAAAFAIRFVRFVPQHELSTMKVSLFNGATTANLLFNVKSASRARNMFLRLDTHFNEFEFDISKIAGDYEASSWLSFVLPINDDGIPLPPFSTNLGEVLVPIPLRAYPAVPSMAQQAGRASFDVPDTVAKAKSWTWSFDFIAQEAAQDTLYLQVQFNQQLAAGLLAGPSPATLGAALAQFVSAWPDVSSALTALLTWNGSSDPVLAQTVQSFAEMADAVGQAWEPVPEMAAEGDTLTTLYDYRVDATSRTSADGAIDYRQSQLLTIDGPSPSPTGDFPSISWRRPGGRWTQMTMQSHTTTTAIYLFDEDVTTTETIEQRLEYGGLDVVEWQNASGAARLTRNEHLVAGAATAPQFVYNTGLIGFAAPFVPFVQHENLIVFNDSLPLGPALQQLFTDLLGSTSPTSYWLKVSVEFGYEIVIVPLAARPIASFLPVGFLPASQYTTALPSSIDQLITTWLNGKPFTATQGLFSLDVSIFTTCTPPDAAQIPILRLNHLVYDNSGGGSSSFADRLSAANARRLEVIRRRLERERVSRQEGGMIKSTKK